MKKFTLLFILTAFIFSFKSFATTYTFIGNGDWKTAANWQGGVRPPDDYTNADTVIITGTCTLYIDQNIMKYSNYGFMWVKSGGTLSIFEDSDGFIPARNFNNFGGMHIDGTLNNSTGFDQEGMFDLYGTANNYSIFALDKDATLHSNSNFVNNNTLGFGAGKFVSEPGANFINKSRFYGSIVFSGTASIVNNATISPGNSPGTASISGDYTAGSTAIHNFEVAGAGAGQYDKLVATGTVNLNGTLNVTLLSGYVPQVTDNIPLFTGSSITGTFTTVNKPSQYQLVYNATSVMLRNTSTLPVTFSNVDVKKEGASVNLTWKMQNELNVSRYEIEKSENGINFKKIGERTAASLPQYNFADIAGENKEFYRIKSVDKDGRYSYSIVVMYSGGKAKISLRVFPSPAKTVLTVQHAVAAASSRLVVSSIDGKAVQTVFPANGAQTTTIDLSNLNAGSYLVRYYNSDVQVETVKFIKQ